MKVVLTIVAAGFFAAFSAAGSAIENPIGPPTIPQSSFGGGLVASPNPVDTSGNRVITGNVSGGRHFLGIVPYRAPSDFSGVLGSSSLDSFLRSSAGSVDIDNYTGTYRPYYSPSRTVVTTSPGVVGVIRPPTTRIDGRTIDRVDPASSSGGEVLVFQGLPIQRYGSTYGEFGLVQITPQETSEGVSADVGRYADNLRSTSAREQVRAQEIFQGISQGEALTKDVRKGYFLVENQRAGVEPDQFRQELKQMLLEGGQEGGLVQLRGRFMPGQEERRVGEADSSAELDYRVGSLKAASKESTQTDTLPVLESRLLRPDSYFAERRRAEVSREDTEDRASFELGRLAEPLDKTEVARLPGDGSTAVKTDRGQTVLSESAKSELLEGLKQRVLDEEGYGRTERPADGFRFRRAQVTLGGDFDESDIVDSDAYRRSRERPSELSRLSYEERARAIMGPYKTVASFSEAKFNEHVRAGEQYLKQGKYYRAADAYSLAAIYKAESPLVCIGKSHALFGAGVYEQRSVSFQSFGDVFGFQGRIRGR
jgi:hypothetical protein